MLFAGPSVRGFIERSRKRPRSRCGKRVRRRARPELTSLTARSAARDALATNLPIQGRRRHLKKAMIDVHAALPSAAGGRARMILTVHDELLFEAPEEAADETVALVREKMEQAVKLKVPLTVDVGIGHNWKEAKS